MTEIGKKFDNELKEKLNTELKEKMKDKKVLAIGAVVIVILFLVLITRGCGGKGISMSEDEIAQTALKQAEQDYGYKLTLDSCKVIDTSSSKRKWPMTGEKVKVNVYGVLLKADANDSEGNTVESVKYEVVITQWDFDNNIIAQAWNYSDKEDDAIIETIKEDVKNAK